MCQRCGIASRSRRDKPPVRKCCYLLIVGQPDSCPFHSIVTRLAPAGVARLRRCRAAECGLMHIVDGQVICTGMEGRRCEKGRRWGERLNGEAVFPSGVDGCPHWG